MSKKTRIPFEAYRGKEPYIFVSYAHKDSAQVYPQILDLHNAGYHIWYDEGIEPGRDWTEEIGRALQNAAFFITFISPNSVESKNVRNEINFALEKKTPFLAIYLEETQLPAGLMLQIGSIQAIMKYNLAEEKYFAKLTRVLKSRFENVSEITAVRPAFSAKPGFLANKLFLLTTILLIAGSISIIKFFPDLITTTGGELEEQNAETQSEQPPETTASTQGNNQPRDNPNNTGKLDVKKIEKPAADLSEANKRKILLTEIDNAKKEMNTTRENVPGSKMDKDEDDNYQQALAKKDTGETELIADNLPEALRSFKQATRLFVKSRESIFKSNADEAETAMQEARNMAEPDGKNEKTFQDAFQAESAGKEAYDHKNYDRARELYQKADRLYVRVSKDVMARIKAVEKAIENILSQYKRSLETEDIAGLRALCKDFPEKERKHWSNVFKIFEIQGVVLGSVKKEIISSNSAKVDVLFQISYKNNRGEDKKSIRQYKWTLEQIDEKWVIAKFDDSK